MGYETIADDGHVVLSIEDVPKVSDQYAAIRFRHFLTEKLLGEILLDADKLRKLAAACQVRANTLDPDGALCGMIESDVRCTRHAGHIGAHHGEVPGTAGRKSRTWLPMTNSE